MGMPQLYYGHWPGDKSDGGPEITPSSEIMEIVGFIIENKMHV